MKIPFLPAKPDTRSFHIRQPCPKNWADMKGNDQKRFCDHCNLHVHNVSAMSPGQINSLLKTPGRRCISYLRKKDGTIRLRPRFTYPRNFPSRALRLATSLLALLFPFFFAGCNSQSDSSSDPVSITAYRIPNAAEYPGEDRLEGELVVESENENDPLPVTPPSDPVPEKTSGEFGEFRTTGVPYLPEEK